MLYTRLVYRADYCDGGVLVDELMPALAEAKCCATGSWDAELIDEVAPLSSEFVADKN